MAGRGELSVRVLSLLDHDRRRGRIGRARALATIAGVSCLTTILSPVASPVAVVATAHSRAPSAQQPPVSGSRRFEPGAAPVAVNTSPDSKKAAFEPSHSSAGTNFDIRTPLGDLTARADAEGRATALPLYPGAHVLRDESKGGHGVVDIATQLFTLKVAAATFETPDPPASVLTFYRAAMSAFGDVVECHGRVEFRGEAYSGQAVCRRASDAREMQLAVGTPEDHRLVVVKPHLAGSEFALVHVDSRQPPVRVSIVGIRPKSR